MCGFRCRHYNRCGMPCIDIFNFGREYRNACLSGCEPDAWWGVDLHHTYSSIAEQTPYVPCLPICIRINSHVDGFRETKITNNLFLFSVYMWKRRHRESNTNNIYMLDSLESYWNTIIPYRQNTACDGMHIRKCAWLDSTTLGETKNVPLQGNRHGRFELHLRHNTWTVLPLTLHVEVTNPSHK